MSLDWPNERYVRLYTRDTTTWKLLSWQARTVLLHLLRKVDRSGVLEVGEDGLEGLEAQLELPAEVVARGIEQLTRRGVVVATASAYVLPNFQAAQESRSSDAQRQRDSRERRRAAALGSVTERDRVSPAVTPSHRASPDVTPSLAVPSLAEQGEPERETAAPRSSPPADAGPRSLADLLPGFGPDVPRGAPEPPPTPHQTAPARAGAREALAPRPSPHLEPAERLWARQELLRKEINPRVTGLDVKGAKGRRRLTRVIALLAAGWTEPDLLRVLESFAARCRSDPSQLQWLNGETNWRPDNVDREFGRLGTPRSPPAGARGQPGSPPAAPSPARFEPTPLVPQSELEESRRIAREALATGYAAPAPDLADSRAQLAGLRASGVVP